MTTLGMYRPGGSALHRLTAGWKLAGLVVAGVCVVLLDQPWQVGVALLVVAAGFRWARVPWRVTLRQVRPLLWVGIGVAVFHVLVSGVEQAVVVVGMLAVLVWLAGLVTLTTRTTDLVDAVVTACGPLRRIGVRPERLGLLLALSIRCVPVVLGLARGVRDAQRARGLGASPRAFAVPLLVRSVRHADALGEALVARGADD